MKIALIDSLERDGFRLAGVVLDDYAFLWRSRCRGQCAPGSVPAAWDDVD